MPRTFTRPWESGSALAISLLGLAVLVTIGLSWEAFRSARNARAAAESVLRDYASFAAVQFGRETQARLDTPISSGLAAVRHRVTGHEAALARAGERDCDCAPPAATQTMFVVTGDGVKVLDGPPLDEIAGVDTRGGTARAGRAAAIRAGARRRPRAGDRHDQPGHAADPDRLHRRPAASRRRLRPRDGGGRLAAGHARRCETHTSGTDASRQTTPRAANGSGQTTTGRRSRAAATFLR